VIDVLDLLGWLALAVGLLLAVALLACVGVVAVAHARLWWWRYRWTRTRADMPETRIRRRGLTAYSDRQAGDRGNHGTSVRFDLTDGYVGISQFVESTVADRVLLTPAQWRALREFVQAETRRPTDG